MLNVVFTGPASDVLGQVIVRANLVAACQASGRVAVQDGVKPSTDLVVASRADTVKARSAATRGLKVMTYQQFLVEHLAGIAIPAVAKWNWFTDAAVKVKKEVKSPPPAGDEGLDPKYVL